jgi:hypothetical protein
MPEVKIFANELIAKDAAQKVRHLRLRAALDEMTDTIETMQLYLDEIEVKADLVDDTGKRKDE